jgi:hypothetical protein
MNACSHLVRGHRDDEAASYTHLIGETPFTIKTVTDLNGSSVALVKLHGDETTAEKAASKVLGTYGGSFLTIENGGERLLTFVTRGKTYRFDPNRMFSHKGIRNSLELHSSYSKKALSEIRQFASSLLKKLPQHKLIVAVHNNGDEEYSANHYLMNGPLSKEAGAVFININMDADDFVFATSKAMFDLYKLNEINVVLQNNSVVTVDGSLSVYCAKNNKPYVNIEAEHGHYEVHVRMLELLFQKIDVIADLNLTGMRLKHGFQSTP